MANPTVQSSTSHITMRITPEDKANLQAAADRERKSLSQYIKDNLVQLQPIPYVVQDILKRFTEGLKVPASYMVNVALISLAARWAAEEQLYGKPLLNPFLKVEEGHFIENWDEAFAMMAETYRDTLFSDAASMKAHEQYLQWEKADLYKLRMKLKEKYGKKI